MVSGTRRGMDTPKSRTGSARAAFAASEAGKHGDGVQPVADDEAASPGRAPRTPDSS